MGYDLHIHRAGDWTEAESNPITHTEWAEYVAHTPEFRMDNFAETRTPAGEVIRIEKEGLAVWIGHPSTDTASFDYDNGRIVVKNPDATIRQKMFEVATSLDARLQGDDGEYYGPDGKPDTAPPPPSTPKPSLMKRLFRAGG